MSRALLLNLGCGSVFHPGWINLDTSPGDLIVRRWDVRRGLPFKDGEVDACYSSHVLEHLTRPEVELLLAECRRVLRPAGILRLVVPDLESIARHYLRLLEAAAVGKAGAAADYDWILLEMYDQTVRFESGGDMARYLSKPDIPNRAFVVSRIGLEADATQARSEGTRFERFVARARSLAGRDRLACAALSALARLLGGTSLQGALREGLFRNSGEVHKWMYDRFSLQRLLEQSGFTDVRPCAATVSGIADFGVYGLDAIDGRARKPDSLFMEGLKS